MNDPPDADTRIRVTGHYRRTHGRTGTVAAVLPNGGTARNGKRPLVAVDIDDLPGLAPLLPDEIEPLELPGGTP